MKINVRLFALQREQLGWSERAVDMAEGTTIASLMDALAQDYPAIAEAAPHLLVAVNGEYAEPGTVLHPGDEVALIPPVSGGGSP
ncbi:MAG: molybdopterin converting factor subunit 1 [Chloroflexi bacterium]|nr:molybdopterin converting factor subunit 1 [Chloroflexota bacterium]